MSVEATSLKLGNVKAKRCEYRTEQSFRIVVAREELRSYRSHVERRLSEVANSLNKFVVIFYVSWNLSHAFPVITKKPSVYSFSFQSNYLLTMLRAWNRNRHSKSYRNIRLLTFTVKIDQNCHTKKNGQVGSRETGLDVLLRCLEVLSTSELSSFGPTPASTSSEEARSNGGSAMGDEASDASARASIIQGLVRVLTPWEHSRKTQRAALLVLGNVAENVLDGSSPSVARDCRRYLEDTLVGTTAPAASVWEAANPQKEEEKEQEQEHRQER